MNFKDVTNIRIPQGEVIQIQDSLSRILWKKSSPTPSYSTPFYVEDMSGSENIVSIVKRGMYTSNAPTLTIEISRDGVSWSTLGTTSDVALTASVPANGKLYLRCSTSGWGNQYHATAAYNAIDCSGSYGVGGNIMSLIYGDSFVGDEVDFKSLATYRLVFVNLFSGSINLIESSSLILPATTLVIAGAGPGWEPTDVTMWGCYSYMFRGCTSLTTAPALPATTLAERCYTHMFDGCTSLTTTPALPATTLAKSCYSGMFYNCTSLATAPSLPATTLAENCYNSMFLGCTSLTTAPTLPATTLALSCYQGMFDGCTSLTTAPTLPATTLFGGCYTNMFYNCRALTTAPELPATTLAQSCYSNMFYNCRALTTAPALPATKLTNYCYEGMFQGCTKMNNITCLATDISAVNCLDTWVNGVSQTGTFTKKAGVTWPTGVSGIPEGWTVIEE